MGALGILVRLSLLSLGYSVRVKDSIYTDFTRFQACFKRLNGTMEFGCTSDLGGNVGVLKYIDSQDISSIESDEFAPYIVLLSPDLFGGSMLTKLKDTGNVNGIILPGTKEGKWKGKLPTAESDDSSCPNSGSSLYDARTDQCGSTGSPWNPAGGNLLWTNWDFPIFYVSNSNITEPLYDCYDEHNSAADSSWPLCAVELSSPMYAAKDSETCWRRSTFVNSLAPQHYCDPLSDNNIFHFAKPRNSTAEDNTTVTQSPDSVILVVARMDALNIFDKEEVGFDSPSTGIVTLLAAANTVARALKSRTDDFVPGVENILFLLVHGESFDYIGSTRAVYDMMNQSFPFKIDQDNGDIRSNGTQPTFELDSIKLIVELGQLSNKNTGQMFLHTQNADANINKVIASLKDVYPNFRQSSRTVLPPSSSQSFLKERSDIPVLFVSNYDGEYANPYYHSIFDTAEVNGYNYTLGDQQNVVRHLAQVSSAVSSAILSLATGSVPALPDSGPLVNELLACYTETANCTLFKEASNPALGFPWTDPTTSQPLPQYVSVHTSGHTVMTKQVLQYLTGVVDNGVQTEGECEDGEECEEKSLAEQQSECLARNQRQQVFKYNFFTGKHCYNETGPYCGNCYRSTVDLSLATSPAFEPDIFDSYDWNSGKYPTWTESIWKSLSGRMFLKASPVSQHVTLAIGILVLFFSFLLTYLVERKADVIFQVSTPDPLINSTPVAL